MTAALSHQMHVPDPAVDAEQLLTQISIHWQYLHPQTINPDRCLMLADDEATHLFTWTI